MKVTVTATRSLVALALLLAALLVATAAGQAAQQGSPSGNFVVGEPPTFDGDGNGLFDDLEARLSKLSDDSKVDVLVQLDASATAARVGDLSSRLGGFATGKRFGIVDAFSAKMTKAQAERLARMPSVAHVELDGEVHALNDTAQASFGVTKARIDDPALDGDGDGNPNVYSPVRPRRGRDRHRHRREPPRPRRRQGAGVEGLRQQPHDAVRRQRPRQPRLRHDRRRRRRALRPPVPRRRAGGRPDRAEGAELGGQRLLLQRDRRARLDRRQQDDLRHRGREPLARRRRLQQRHRPHLAGDPARGQRRDRRRGRGRQRRPRHLHRRHARRGAGGADRGRDDRPRPRRLLPRLVLEPRPDCRRPHQARHRRPGRLGHLGGREHDQRLHDLQRHEHGDAVRRRRVPADARCEPVADAAADQGRHDLHRGGLGPVGRRRRLRRGQARRLRGAARGRRAARHDRRHAAGAHLPQRQPLGLGPEHRHHAQRDRHAVADRGDADRVGRLGRDLVVAELQPRAAQLLGRHADLVHVELPPEVRLLPAHLGRQLHPSRVVCRRQRPVLRRHLGRHRPCGRAGSAGAERSGRTDARLGIRGRIEHPARLDGAVLERRFGDHGLQDLPRRHDRQRDAVRDHRYRHELHRPERHARHGLLLQGQRRERRRRGRPLQRALGHRGDRPDRARRAEPDRRDRGHVERRARVERAVLERRLGDHRLQGLPRHLDRRRDVPRQRRHDDGLHRFDRLRGRRPTTTRSAP